MISSSFQSLPNLFRGAKYSQNFQTCTQTNCMFRYKRRETSNFVQSVRHFENLSAHSKKSLMFMSRSNFHRIFWVSLHGLSRAHEVSTGSKVNNTFLRFADD